MSNGPELDHLRSKLSGLEYELQNERFARQRDQQGLWFWCFLLTLGLVISFAGFIAAADRIREMTATIRALDVDPAVFPVELAPPEARP